MKTKIQSIKSKIREHKRIVNFVAKIFFVIVFLLFFLQVVMNTLSKYESDASSSADVDVAFFIVNSTTETASIKLGELLPRSTPYTYNILVNNFKGSDMAEVNLEYSIELEATTNLPLEYELYKNRNASAQNNTDIITNDEIIQNADGMYFRKLETNTSGQFGFVTRETDVYTLSVTFPEIYQNNADEYIGVIESVRVKIHAEQVV